MRRARLAMLAMWLPLALSLHCASRGCDVRLRRRPALVMAQADDDDRPQDTDGMSLGDLLAEVATRQQTSLPDRGAQRSLSDSTLSAMLDTASSELASTFEALTVNLSAVERNVSTTLSSELTSAGSAQFISRLNRVRDTMIQPGRRQVQAEIDLLIEAAEERRNATAALFRASESTWGRDDVWWRERLAAGGSYVSALTASAGVLGLLLAAAAVDLALGHPGDEWRTGLALAWRGSFLVGLAVYMFSLGSLTQRPAGQDDGDD